MSFSQLDFVIRFDENDNVSENLLIFVLLVKDNLFRNNVRFHLKTAPKCYLTCIVNASLDWIHIADFNIHMKL